MFHSTGVSWSYATCPDNDYEKAKQLPVGHHVGVTCDEIICRRPASVVYRRVKHLSAPFLFHRKGRRDYRSLRDKVMAKSVLAFKVSFGDEIKKLSLRYDHLSFDVLLPQVATLFSLKPQHVSLKYVDQDGDRITMSCDEDLEDAVEQFKHANAVKLFVTVSSVPVRTLERDDEDFEVVRLAPEEVAVAGEDSVVPEVEPLASSESSLASTTEEKNESVSVDSARKVLESLKASDPSSLSSLMEALGFVSVSSVSKEATAGASPVVSPTRVPSAAGASPALAPTPVPAATGVSPSRGPSGIGAPAPIPGAAPVLFHYNVECDVCKMNPIAGIRYKCSMCTDFDLCESCEASCKHPSSHPLIKMRVPRTLSPVAQAFTPASSSASAPPKKTKYHAKYVKDVTIEDRCNVAPGSFHQKVWKLINSGCTRWPAGFGLIQVSGDTIVDPESVKGQLGEVGPGEEFTVSAPIQVPTKPGRYTSYFRLSDLEGKPFGPRIWVDFVVPEGNPDSPAVPVECPYAAQLEELKALGFTDEPLNKFLLVKFSGEVSGVINWLLDGGNQL